MTAHVKVGGPVFKVIDGSVSNVATRPSRDMPATTSLDLSGAELAAEMADLFALGLLQDVPFEKLGDAHHVVRIDPATRFTLHELLCELRSLGWHDAKTAPFAAANCSLAMQEGDSHRRSIRWNGDGQLTLRTLYRGGVSLMGESAVLAQSMDRGAQTVSLSQLALDVFDAAPGSVFADEVRQALADGVAFDAGLTSFPGAGEKWTNARLGTLLAQAHEKATRGGLAKLIDPRRMARPAVTAARMSVYLSRDDSVLSDDAQGLQSAADELAHSAPNLLQWMTRANQARRGTLRLPVSLFLPLEAPDALPLHPADAAAHCHVAGALGTLVKAIFDTGAGSRLAAVGQGLSLAQEMDRLMANVSLARAASGGYYPAENWQDLRCGQAIAVEMLRETLAEDNRSAELAFRDLDGRAIRLVAHPRQIGAGHVELYVDGTPKPWPQGDLRGTHLTAVV